jgi:hypothetical protein
MEGILVEHTTDIMERFRQFWIGTKGSLPQTAKPDSCCPDQDSPDEGGVEVEEEVATRRSGLFHFDW